MKRRAVGSVLAGALILSFASAWLPIAASALELAWTAPTSCPSQVEVQQRIDSLLGPSSARTTARATALVTTTRAGYQLKLTLSGGVEGSRRLTGKDCSALAESAAFLIAVAIDPSLLGTQPVPEPNAEPAPPAEVQPAPAPASSPAPVTPLPAPAPAPTRSAWFHAAGFGGLWQALDPVQVQLGGALGAGMEAGFPRISLRHQLELRGAYALPVTQVVLSPRGRGELDTKSANIELSACELWAPQHFFLGPCVVASGTRTEGAGDFARRDGSGTVYWASAGVSIQAGVRLSGWPMPFVEVGAVTAVTPRPSFTVDNKQVRVNVERTVFYARLGVRFDWQLSLHTRQP